MESTEGQTDYRTEILGIRGSEETKCELITLVGDLIEEVNGAVQIHKLEQIYELLRKITEKEIADDMVERLRRDLPTAMHAVVEPIGENKKPPAA